jgi:hypothetical protein
VNDLAKVDFVIFQQRAGRLLLRRPQHSTNSPTAAKMAKNINARDMTGSVRKGV